MVVYPPPHSCKQQYVPFQIIEATVKVLSKNKSDGSVNTKICPENLFLIVAEILWETHGCNATSTQHLSSAALPAVSCCPTLTRSFVSDGWRSLLPSRWQDQMKRCTQDGWAQSEWKIGGQAKIFSVLSLFSSVFAVFCQTDDVQGKYYLFCFHSWFCLDPLRLEDRTKMQPK